MTNFKKYFMLIALGLAVISLLGYACVGSDETNADLKYLLEDGKPIDYSYKEWPVVGYGLAVQKAPIKGGGTNTTTVFQMVYMDPVSFPNYNGGDKFPKNTMLIMEQPEAYNDTVESKTMMLPQGKKAPKGFRSTSLPV